MNNRQVTLSDLYAIIGRQTAEIEFLMGQIQQLQTMVEGLQEPAEKEQNGVVLDEREIIGWLQHNTGLLLA